MSESSGAGTASGAGGASDKVTRLQLPEDAEGRLDSLVSGLLPDLSRRRLKAAFKTGQVRQAGRRVAGSDSAHPGAEVTIAGLAPEASPEAPSLEIVADTGGLLVVEKPVGLPTAPAAVGGDASLAEYVLRRFPELAGVGDLPGAPGLCHRLDRETSGLVLFARTPELFAGVRAAFEAREVEKVYLAVVVGDPPDAGECTLPLGRRKGRSRRMEIDAPEVGRKLRSSWPAHTTFEVLERAGDRSVLEVRITTGVTHQIRAHLAHLGFPVLGDPLYGDPAATGGANDGRLYLHAQRLALTHPETGEHLSWESAHGFALRTLLGGQDA